MDTKKKSPFETYFKYLLSELFFIAGERWYIDFPSQKKNNTEERKINKSKKTRECYGQEEGGLKQTKEENKLPHL